MEKVSQLQSLASGEIANDDVIYIVDTSATLGKKLSIADLKSNINAVVINSTPAKGDIIYFNGTNWVSLIAGTSGYFLRTNGAGVDPSWTAAGLATSGVENGSQLDATNMNVFKAKTGVNLDFRSLKSTDGSIRFIENADSLDISNNTKWKKLIAGTHFEVDVPSGFSNIRINMVDGSGWNNYIYGVGLPLKYVYNSTTYYGVVKTVSIGGGGNDDYIELYGPALNDTIDLTELYVGDSSLIETIHVFIPSTYADGTTSALINTDTGAYLKFNNALGYLCKVELTHKVVDSTTQPVIRPLLGGLSVFSSNITLTTAGAWIATITANSTNYVANFGETIELQVETAGGSGNAEGLSAIFTFVLP